MDDLASIELLVRGAAAGGFLGLALCLGRARPVRLRLSAILLCLSCVGHVLAQSPAARAAIGPAFPAAWLLSISGAGLFWAFATDLFSDEARSLARRFGPTAATLALAIVGARLCPAPPVWTLYSLIAAGLIGHALYVIARTSRDDLVERRRRLRGPMLVSAAGYALAVVALEFVQMLWRPLPELSPLGAAALLFLSLSGMAVFLDADADLVPAGPRPTAPRLTPADQVLLSRLNQAMDEDEVWRTEGLTMFDLATKVGAPEHRLRRLINTELGHRNFSVFLNERRVEAAKALLASPDLALRSVSSIAYEVGFSSLGPFNRAFKALTGVTPSDWRAQAAG